MAQFGANMPEISLQNCILGLMSKMEVKGLLCVFVLKYVF